MAQLIDSNEAMFTAFEPKVKFRFIMYIAGIPSFIIKKVDRPKFESAEVVLPHINVERYTKGKSKWNEITAELYDPIVPSGAQAVMEWVRAGHESVTGRDGYADFYQKDVTINVLGPVDDIVEEWILKAAWCKSADFQDLDWADESSALTCNITIRYNYALLNF
jgi:hypothetical protein